MKKYLTVQNGIIALTFVLILVSGIYTEQNAFYMVPLCISLIVMALQSSVNRIGYLIGSINSCIYAVVYFSMGIYATATSAIFVSFPIGLITFLRWKKKAYGQATVFRKISAKMRILGGLGFLCVFGLIYYILSLVGYDYALLDLGSSTLGFLYSGLCMFGFVEYSYLQLLGAALNIGLNVQVMLGNPAHITYLIFSVYSAYCQVRTFINVKKIYRLQNKE